MFLSQTTPIVHSWLSSSAKNASNGAAETGAEKSLSFPVA
jgi:hypothetical protein